MKTKVVIEVPEHLLTTWQETANLLADIATIPAALIMRFTDPNIEHYLITHPEAQFSHTLCPTCHKEMYPDLHID